MKNKYNNYTCLVYRGVHRDNSYLYFIKLNNVNAPCLFLVSYIQSLFITSLCTQSYFIVFPSDTFGL